MAPGSDWAKRAYVVLEEETLADYSGSGGVHMPPDVREELRELERIAVGGSGAAPPSSEDGDDAAEGDGAAAPASPPGRATRTPPPTASRAASRS